MKIYRILFFSLFLFFYTGIIAEKKETKSSVVQDKKKNTANSKKNSHEKQKNFRTSVIEVLQYGTYDEIINVMGSLKKTIVDSNDKDIYFEFLLKLVKNSPFDFKIQLFSLITKWKYKKGLEKIQDLFDTSQNDFVVLEEKWLDLFSALEYTPITAKLLEYFKEKDLTEESSIIIRYIETLKRLKNDSFCKYIFSQLKLHYESIEEEIKYKEDNDELDEELDEEEKEKYNNAKIAINTIPRIIQTLGELEYKDSKKFLLKLLASSFKKYNDENKSKNNLFDNYTTIPTSKSIQEMLVYALRKLKYKPATVYVEYFIKFYVGNKKINKDKFVNLYLHCLAFLVYTENNDFVRSILKNSMRNNNAQIRIKAIKLLAEVPFESAIPIIKFRFIKDVSRQVRFNALITLLEIFKPGSTGRYSNKKGRTFSAGLKLKAKNSLLFMLEKNNNPNLSYRSVVFIINSIYNKDIYYGVLNRFNKDLNGYLSRERQNDMVKVLIIMANKSIQEDKKLDSKLKQFIEQLSKLNKHKYSASYARKTLKRLIKPD